MIDDLFRDEETERIELPPYETLNRRPFRILVGSLVGLFLVSLGCLLVYLLVIVPGNRDREEAQARLVETQNASIAQTLAAELATATPEPVVTPTPLPSPTATQTPPSPSPSPTETPEPTLTPTPEPTDTPSPLPQVLLTDAFGGGSAWVVQNEENFELSYSGGGYRMFVNIFFAEIWSVRGQSYGDVRLEVDTALQAGPEDGFYGVVCRFQNDANYYSLVIDGRAGYRIFKKVGGTVEDLVGPTPSAVIQTEGTNRLRADCVGDTLRLFVNGEQLAEVQDGEFAEGSVGMLAGTRAVAGTEVIFDNLLLAVP